MLKIISQQQGVVARLIATDENLHDFSIFKDQDNHILSGWRYDIFGKYAQDLRHGKLSITYNPKTKDIELQHYS